MAQSEIQGLRGFSADMRQAAGELFEQVDSVFVETAADLRDEYRADARASKHYFRIANSISYDSRFSGLGVVGYEIGPRKGGQANLANIAYFGGARGGKSLDLDGPFTKWGAVLDKRLDKMLGWLG